MSFEELQLCDLDYKKLSYAKSDPAQHPGSAFTILIRKAYEYFYFMAKNTKKRQNIYGKYVLVAPKSVVECSDPLLTLKDSDVTPYIASPINNPC